jgi:hypothetical protein
MRCSLIVWVLFGFLSQGAALLAAPLAPVVEGFAVHEWGVFRVYDDLDLANADMKAIWQAAPKFVYGQVVGRDLPKHWPNLQPVDKPVVFFHAPKPMDVRLRVDFPSGVPALWWPGTRIPATYGSRRVAEPPKGEPYRYLEWSLHLKEKPPRYRNAMPPADPQNWAKALRAVKADDVFARVGEDDFGCECERFVYYDGLVPRKRWVSIAVGKDAVTLTSNVDFPVFDVTVVEQLDGGKVRVGRLERLDGRTRERSVALGAVDAARWTEDGPRALLAQLKAAGLNEDEGGSLVALWKKDLLLADGVTLFYRLPQEEYDRLLPLVLEPRPEKLVRVGLVQQPHCEPDLPRRVADLVRQLDADDFEARERAHRRLDDMGRAAFVHLVRMRRDAKDPEARRRLDQLIEKYDSTRIIWK